MKYYPICDDCINGKGKECHTPGCVYCFNDVPKEIGIPELGINILEELNRPEAREEHPVLPRKILKMGFDDRPNTFVLKDKLNEIIDVINDMRKQRA